MAQHRKVLTVRPGAAVIAATCLLWVTVTTATMLGKAARELAPNRNPTEVLRDATHDPPTYWSRERGWGTATLYTMGSQMTSSVYTQPEAWPSWAGAEQVGPPGSYVEAHAFGWPLYALAVRRRVEVRQVQDPPFSGRLVDSVRWVADPSIWPESWAGSVEAGGFLPNTIIWRGAIFNTGFYAATAFAARWLWRAGRRMSHRAKAAVPCIRCGYELAGLQTAAVCPECGATQP